MSILERLIGGIVSFIVILGLGISFILEDPFQEDISGFQNYKFGFYLIAVSPIAFWKGVKDDFERERQTEVSEYV